MTRHDESPGKPPHQPPREWLTTNGLGGYGSGTVDGALSRRYHGLLVAAHPAPLGRVVALVDMEAALRPDAEEPYPLGPPTAFELERGLPLWTYRVLGRTLRRRLVMCHGQNTVSMEYALVDGDPVELELRPRLQPRRHEEPVDTPFPGPAVFPVDGGIDMEVDGFPTLRLRYDPGHLHFHPDPEVDTGVRFGMEEERGYAATGALWSPGTLRCTLTPGEAVTIVASTAPAGSIPQPRHEAILADERARRDDLVDRAGAADDPLRARLALAADAFIVQPVFHGRESDARSVIAGYHWFTDWGRDTMIALEGLTLTTGRANEAAAILRMFAAHVRDGLIPNLFPETGHDGLYHTADATLWFFHAVHRYVETSGDRELLRELLPVLREIVDCHVDGTRFGIAVDPDDYLLHQGEAGYQLTWMDAKVDDWVVTPRRGKAVEINALWYNALRLMADWVRVSDRGQAEELDARADRTRDSFNRRFWYEAGGYLYDVIDGEDVRVPEDAGGVEAGADPAFRPNQLFAISLDHPILDSDRWRPVLDRASERLLTPVGLRSLAPGHPEYQPAYTGDLRSRDAAYHQGTVWGWLIGPYVDAWLRVYPDRNEEALRALDGLIAHLDQAGAGSASEVFDASPPFTPRGCIAQAWSVAELLRCLARVSPADPIPYPGSMDR